MKKEIYKIAKQGIYYFSVPNYNGEFTRYSVPIIILGETEKSYRISFKMPAAEHMVGDRIWALKKNIQVEEKVDTTQMWYQDI